ncbi:MAG: hypothetical protein KatS3mg057_2497 [Herpetosiphonaceae bacterium]|nr:MAG: hypothetical protein KatS3mg057_2497 [Herpetosiphonaceae bacterium]
MITLETAEQAALTSYSVVVCPLAARETVLQTYALARWLDEHVPLRNAPRIRLSAASHSCNHNHDGDIRLQEPASSQTAAASQSIDVDLAAGEGRTLHLAAAALWSELPQLLTTLLRSFIVERCAHETFREYIARFDAQALSERLGLSR